MDGKNHPELICKLGILGLGCGIIIVSTQYGFGSLKYPGPGLYPFFVGAVILFFGFIDFIRGKEHRAKERLFDSNSEIKNFALLCIIFLFWIIGMPYLGYTVMSSLASLLISKVIGLEGWLKPLILSILTSLFIYLVFNVWFYTDLPRGILG
jgi:hypothetical protein